MPVSAHHFLAVSCRARVASAHSPLLFFSLLPLLCPAASIRGVVTDASGAKVTGANVVLHQRRQGRRRRRLHR